MPCHHITVITFVITRHPVRDHPHPLHSLAFGHSYSFTRSHKWETVTVCFVCQLDYSRSVGYICLSIHEIDSPMHYFQVIRNGWCPLILRNDCCSYFPDFSILSRFVFVIFSIAVVRWRLRRCSGAGRRTRPLGMEVR